MVATEGLKLLLNSAVPSHKIRSSIGMFLKLLVKVSPFYVELLKGPRFEEKAKAGLDLLVGI